MCLIQNDDFLNEVSSKIHHSRGGFGLLGNLLKSMKKIHGNYRIAFV